MKKKKILILTPRFPYPVIGGDRLRIYQVCRALSEKYSLTLLSLCDSRSDLSAPLQEDNIFDRVERIYLPKWRSILNCLLALPGDLPLQVAYYRNGFFRRRVSELMIEHDCTLSHLIRVGDIIKHKDGVRFLEMTDAISLNYERIKKSSHAINDMRSRIFSIEAKRLRKYEESIVDYFDHSFLVSEVDRMYLYGERRERLEKVSVFSNGVALDQMPYNFDANGRDIIFIGNMLSLQNFDAAMYMSTEILPLIRRYKPDVRLRLIGRIKPVDAKKFESIEGVDVTGEVASISDSAQGGGVGVCPLRLGAGVQNKVLEYMALGLPVVSTSTGLEGFSAQDGTDLIVADTPAGFANQILRLLNDRRLASAIAKSARTYVETNHSWSAMLSPMIELIDQRLSRDI